MLRRFSANFAVLSIFLDTFLIVLALYTSASLRESFNHFAFIQEVAEVVVPMEIYVTFAILWVSMMLLFSVYDGRRNIKVTDEFGSLTLASILAAVAMAGVLYFTYRDLSRFLFLFFILLGFILLLAWRAFYRLAFRMQWIQGVQYRQVMILGAGKIGRTLGSEIQKHHSGGLNLVGFLDDDPEKCGSNGDVFGKLDLARHIVLEKQVSDVVIALPLSAHERLNQVVSELHDLPVRVWIIPDYFALTLHKASVEEFAGIPMLDVRAPALREDQRMVKRSFDLVICILTAPLLLPVLGIISLLIKLDSQGPVLYHARRVGENGEIFHMLKFRTMIQNADQMNSMTAATDLSGRTVYKVPYDPRVTRVGKFLRKTSLDELPQLINVIKGDMSLVGPRPEQPFLVDQYQRWQRKRFAVPQGITGWWQINGRSDRPMHLHTEDDLYYVQHYSIWLDLQILARTAWTVLRGKGAY